MTHPSDQQLVDAVLAGDKNRFAELVRRYEPSARAAAIGILQDACLTQDVLQEAFLGAYTNLGQLSDRSRFGPWVLQITRRESFRLLRKRQHVTQQLDSEHVLTVSENNGQFGEQAVELLAAVNRLPNHEQIAVALHYFHGHKVEAIARMTGRTTGTVTKQLSRARRRLKRWLREATK